MNAAAMDTLEAARGLEAAGVEPGQAEAMVKMVSSATVVSREDLATKSDLAELKAELKAEMSEIRLEFAAAVNRMLLSQIAVVGVLLAAMAVLKFF